MPINPSEVQWDDAPTLDAAAVQWDEPATEQDQAGKALGPWASAALRPVAEGVAALPLMAADVGVASRNLSAMAPAKAPQIYDEKTKSYIPDPNFHPETEANYEHPSKMFREALDSYTTTPQTMIGKGAELVSSALVGGLTGAPQAAAQAPAAFAGALPKSATAAAQSAGYVVPPASREGAGVLARTMEGIAGKTSVAQRAAMKNQPRTNELASKAIGLDAVPETGEAWKAALSAVREKAGQIYKQVGDSGEIVPDSAYLDELAQLGKGADEILKDFPDAAPAAAKETEKLVNSLLRDKFDAKSAMEYLKELRKQASGNLGFHAAADPAKRALGMAQREAAATLEDLVMRHLATKGKPELAEAFNKARQQIAKTYVVQGALNEGTGNIIASSIGNVAKKGKPLTDELGTIAKFAQAFPKASKEVTESFPGISPWDAGFALTGSLVAGPAAALYPAARIGLRELLTTQSLPKTVGAAGSSGATPRALAATIAQMENQ